MHTKEKAMENFMEIFRNNPENACDFIEAHYADISQENLADVIHEMILFIEFLSGENFKNDMNEIAIAIDDRLTDREEEDEAHKEAIRLYEKIISECISRMENRYGKDWEKQDKAVKQQVYNEVLAEIKL